METKLNGMARALGAAGLLPMLAVLAVLAGDFSTESRDAALSIGHGYAALILSFLGGLWWGLAARPQPAAVPGWIWIAAVAPSLVAFFPMVGMALGLWGAVPALTMTGGGLLLALLVDRKLVALGLAPVWWMRLRVPLSLGLGGMSLIAAGLA